MGNNASKSGSPVCVPMTPSPFGILLNTRDERIRCRLTSSGESNQVSPISQCTSECSSASSMFLLESDESQFERGASDPFQQCPQTLEQHDRNSSDEGTFKFYPRAVSPSSTKKSRKNGISEEAPISDARVRGLPSISEDRQAIIGHQTSMPLSVKNPESSTGKFELRDEICDQRFTINVDSSQNMHPDQSVRTTIVDVHRSPSENAKTQNIRPPNTHVTVMVESCCEDLEDSTDGAASEENPTCITFAIDQMHHNLNSQGEDQTFSQMIYGSFGGISNDQSQSHFSGAFSVTDNTGSFNHNDFVDYEPTNNLSSDEFSENRVINTACEKTGHSPRYKNCDVFQSLNSFSDRSIDAVEESISPQTRNERKNEDYGLPLSNAISLQNGNGVQHTKELCQEEENKSELIRENTCQSSINHGCYGDTGSDPLTSIYISQLEALNSIRGEDSGGFSIQSQMHNANCSVAETSSGPTTGNFKTHVTTYENPESVPETRENLCKFWKQFPMDNTILQRPITSGKVANTVAQKGDDRRTLSCHNAGLAYSTGNVDADDAICGKELSEEEKQFVVGTSGPERSQTLPFASNPKPFSYGFSKNHKTGRSNYSSPKNRTQIVRYSDKKNGYDNGNHHTSSGDRVCEIITRGQEEERDSGRGSGTDERGGAGVGESGRKFKQTAQGRISTDAAQGVQIIGVDRRQAIQDEMQYFEVLEKDILALYDTPSCKQYFSAYLCVAQEDLLEFGLPFHNAVENWNHKIFLPERDLLLCTFKFEAMSRIVKDRCNGKVIIILSDHYKDSDECRFLTEFAKALDPDAKKRNIIPVVIDKNIEPLPEVLRGLALIRYNRDYRQGWLRDKIERALNA